MSTADKTPRVQVLPLAERLVAALRPYCLRIEVAGSLRRELPMVGDIEVVALPARRSDLFGAPVDGPSLLDEFLKGSGVALGKNGDRYKQFRYGRYTVDLFLPTPETWGSIFTIRTGSWEFSRWLVTSRPAGGAAPDEVQFRDGRLYANGLLLATPEESDVFAALGLVYIEPQERFGPVADPARVEPVWKFA